MRLTFILLIIFFSSCNKSEKPLEPISDRIVAVYYEDGVKKLDIVMRRITYPSGFDSLKMRNVIIADTQFGKPLYFQMIDSLGKPILDSLTHKPKINPQPQYALISKDSVNWRIQGVSVDSLLKK